MIYNCRVNPTTNGLAHLGHLFISLVNQEEAHASGGKFIVRFDDDQEIWIQRLGRDMLLKYKELMVEDFDMFLNVDQYTSQSDYPFFYTVPMPPEPTETQMFAKWVPLGGDALYPDVAGWGLDRKATLFPYAPHLTAQKVMQDAKENINWLIRGYDLVTEFSLYEYIREISHLSPVRHTYLPRLKTEKGGQIDPLSKTKGGYSIRDMTKKYGKEGVMDMLRKSCLIDQDKGFKVCNIKEDPRLVLA